MMNTKRLMKRLATGLLGMSLCLGTTAPSKAARISDNDKVSFYGDEIMNIRDNIVPHYIPFNFYSVFHYAATRANELSAKSLWIWGEVKNLEDTDVDVDDYETFHDTLLMVLNKYSDVCPKLALDAHSCEKWDIDKNGIMVDQSDRHKKIFNYLLLRLYFLARPNHFQPDIKNVTKSDIGDGYKSVSFYINTHIDRDLDGHFDMKSIENMLTLEDVQSQDKIDKEPLFPVPLHEPLVIYHLQRKPGPLGNWWPAGVTKSFTGTFRNIYDTPSNAKAALDRMLHYNNFDIETIKFKEDAQLLFNRYPLSLMEYYNKTRKDRAKMPLWSSLKINNLVIPAFLNIGLGNDVKVSGNSLIVFPAPGTKNVVAMDNGVTIIANPQRDISIQKQEELSCRTWDEFPQFTDKETLNKYDIFLMKSDNICYKY